MVVGGSGVDEGVIEGERVGGGRSGGCCRSKAQMPTNKQMTTKSRETKVILLFIVAPSQRWLDLSFPAF